MFVAHSYVIPLAVRLRTLESIRGLVIALSRSLPTQG